MRSSTSQTTFDRRLFTVMPDGTTSNNDGPLILANNLWHKSVDGVDRMWYNAHSATYFHSGSSFIFRNVAQSADILTIKDSGAIYNGNVGIQSTTLVSMLHLGMSMF